MIKFEFRGSRVHQYSQIWSSLTPKLFKKDNFSFKFLFNVTCLAQKWSNWVEFKLIIGWQIRSNLIKLVELDWIQNSTEFKIQFQLQLNSENWNLKVISPSLLRTNQAVLKTTHFMILYPTCFIFSSTGWKWIQEFASS